MRFFEIFFIVLEAKQKREQEKKDLKAHFDMTCDKCDQEFEVFQDAKSHYQNDHNDPGGYIKCCGAKFSDMSNIKDHVLWHRDPEYFKYALVHIELTSNTIIH